MSFHAFYFFTTIMACFIALYFWVQGRPPSATLDWNPQAGFKPILESG